MTRTLLLGTGIALAVERDPVITAKEVATLDLISGGRAVFGVGAGWILNEMRNHGTDPRTRGRLMDERIRAMIALWTQEKAEFHGEFVDFDPVYSWPKPVQWPHPPIYVGGGSERTFARVAEYGSAWMPSAVPPSELGVDRVLPTCRRCPRTRRCTAWTPWRPRSRRTAEPPRSRAELHAAGTNLSAAVTGIRLKATPSPTANARPCRSSAPSDIQSTLKFPYVDEAVGAPAHRIHP